MALKKESQAVGLFSGFQRPGAPFDFDQYFAKNFALDVPVNVYLSENDQQRQGTLLPLEGESENFDRQIIKHISSEVRQRLKGHESLADIICMLASQVAEAQGLALRTINIRPAWSHEYNERTGLVIDVAIKATADERFVYWDTVCERINELEATLTPEEQRFLNDEIFFLVNRS